MMRWDFNHIENRRARQIENSVVLSTYENIYSTRKPRFSRLQKQLMALLLIFASLFLLLESGLLDWISVLWR